jgi:nicotinamide N-methyltransferase
LSSDRRRNHRKGLHSNQESEADLSENQAARARSAKVSRLVSKATKRRQRSGTTSSAQSRSSTPAVHTDDGIVSPKAHPKSVLASSGTQSETSVHVRSASETSRGESTSHESASAGHDAPVIPEEEPLNPEEPVVRRVSSGASLSATTPQSSSDVTPATPALAPGVSATTDDEDTDFQSAYSASPRESYVEGQEELDNEDDDITPAIVENGRSDNLEHLTVAKRSKVKRERVSSTATAVQRREPSQSSPTFSEDTVVSSGTHSRRILVEA